MRSMMRTRQGIFFRCLNEQRLSVHRHNGEKIGPVLTWYRPQTSGIQGCWPGFAGPRSSTAYVGPAAQGAATRATVSQATARISPSESL